MEENLVAGSEGGDEAEAPVPEPVTVISDVTDGGGPREAVAYHAIHDDLEQLQSLRRRSRHVDVDRDNEAFRSNGVELRARVRGALHTVGHIGAVVTTVDGRTECVEGGNITAGGEVVESKPCGLTAGCASDDAWIALALRAESVSLYWTGKCEQNSRSGPRHSQGRCCCRDSNHPSHLHEKAPFPRRLTACITRHLGATVNRNFLDE